MNLSQPLTTETPLLRAEQLKKYFAVKSGWLDGVRGTVPQIKAVDGVTLDIHKGQTVAVVGESGSGKSTLGRLLLRLLTPTDGQVLYKGRNVMAMDRAELRQFRKRVQVIFQDPYASLNPRMRVGAIIREPLDIYNEGTPAEREARVDKLLEQVGLNIGYGRAYPAELSGGQRQRVGIAAALALSPELIVADEPTSSLDVSVQAQILNLLSDLQKEYQLTFVYITHDLGVVRHFSDRVAVMYLGRIVEDAPSEAVFENPQHPYTQLLFSAIPKPDPLQRMNWKVLEGEPPSPLNPPSGCSFHPRCPHVFQACSQKQPELLKTGFEHRAACFLYQNTAEVVP